jgi:hypothetical protein
LIRLSTSESVEVLGGQTIVNPAESVNIDNLMEASRKKERPTIPMTWKKGSPKKGFAGGIEIQILIPVTSSTNCFSRRKYGLPPVTYRVL